MLVRSSSVDQNLLRSEVESFAEAFRANVTPVVMRIRKQNMHTRQTSLQLYYLRLALRTLVVRARVMRMIRPR